MVACLDRVIGTHNDKHLLGLVVSTELKIKPRELVAEIREVLDCYLAFEFVEINDLVEVLIEACPVVIVWTLVDLDPQCCHPLHEVCLPRVRRTRQPQVALLVLRCDRYRIRNARQMKSQGPKLVKLHSLSLALFHLLKCLSYRYVALKLSEILKH